MLDWLEEWNDPAKFSKILTSQTYTALHSTVSGLLELVSFKPTHWKIDLVSIGNWKGVNIIYQFVNYMNLKKSYELKA
ncbi:unnamed protein product [Acanthoscelides obtectus]|uniref:Uncharacterized protein n=1 Tax=Acanthoscelides obtectus TaxID=200917 RepID=A0A9P0LNB2_ACAOB|nr:unnamed protein product [Acanthoscelides obtectus]CAK1657178.1 hypothetical protein AOBTE_LOCUS20181 [Acanthoscelides obtectus]